jgi:hypothetical protein
MNKNLRAFLLAASAIVAGIPAFASAGGPDSYGYSWKDSNEPGGPLYNWIEIATPAGGSGTYRSAINCDDCHEANIPIGFSFPFYGTSFSTMSIGSNGVVYFENTYLGLSNSCIPGTPSYSMTQYRFIAHLWDDLAPNYQGGIYTQSFANYVVIEYYDIVPCCATGDGDTWQVILFRNGNILMQYKELSNQGLQSDFTVGIQNNPTTGLQYKCDAAGIPLASGRAILFSPPTFSCGTVSQNILGSNTGFCTGGNVTLSAGATSIAQAWSTAATTSSIVVNAAGNYSIYALDTNGCTIRDTVSVAENAPPVVNLGSDFTMCGSAMLDAGNAGMNYLWSDNSTAQMLTATSTGSYSVVVTDPLTTCSNSDTINVTINPLPVVDLGTDVFQCEGTVLLDAGNPGMSFNWSDNSNGQTLTVLTSGTYFVSVADPMTMCNSSDTIMVAINMNPVVALGSDIEQCGGSVVLDAGNPGLGHLWNDNSNLQTLTVTSSGIYSVTVSSASTGCSGSDTIEVTINALPVVALGSDIVQCGGAVTLDAGNAGMNYLWSDSSVSQTLFVNTSGTYFVDVTDGSTLCSASDTIDVTINAIPVVSLGNDVSACGGTVTLDAGNAGMNYQWSDNSTMQTLTVFGSGQYYVIVTDALTNCSGSDTIIVTINVPPLVTFTMSTTTMCLDDAPLTLTGGTPAGGTYSGPGVTGTSFDPSVGAGPQTITYTYTDPNTTCSGSASQMIVVTACTGISEANENGIRLYPNPTNGVLHIETGSAIATVEVYNALGELVVSQALSNGASQVDLSGLENGIYFVRVSTANGNYLAKAVLDH